MIWMGNDLRLINDWESYLKGIHLQHGMGSLLRWTGALQRTHVLPAASACPDASLRERVWDVAVVPESIPLSPLLPPGNEMRSDVDSSPPPVSLYISVALCLYVSLLLSISSFCHPFLLFFFKKNFISQVLSVFPTTQLCCVMLAESIYWTPSVCRRARVSQHYWMLMSDLRLYF